MLSSLGKLVLRLPGGQEQEFTLAKSTVTLGRAVTCDISLADPKLSRSHARVERRETGYTLVDHGSANGTRANGVRIDRKDLVPGDLIAIGDSVLRFELAHAQVSEDITRIDTEADLETTLAAASLSMTLSETQFPRLAVHTPRGTWEMPLTLESLTVGRGLGNDLRLDHPKVSREHARIEQRAEAFVLRDLGSANGTWVRGQRIEAWTLQEGDTIVIGDAQLVFKRGFTSEELTVIEPPDRGEKPDRRPVVVVPGFMGSELWLGGERVWANIKNIFTRPEVFQLPGEHALEPRGLVNEAVIVPNLIKLEQYIRLGDYLIEGLGYERGKDLLEFAYDWRQDNRASAQRLAEAIERWHVSMPVTIIAHSMGCLVSRYYVECLGGKETVERLILLGGPHFGVPKVILALLFGQGLVPLGLMGDRLRQVLVTFPSVYQLLPTYACVSDQEGRPVELYADDSWLPEAQRPHLQSARGFWRELGAHSSVPCVSVFGYGLKTITRASVQREANGGWQKIDFVTEPDGDMTIPESSAVAKGSEIHPVHQAHESLYVDSDVKMRLKLELTRPMQA